MVCLFQAFLAARGYSPALAGQLIRAARGKSGESWEARRLAALLLQHQALRLAPARRRPWGDLLVDLGIAVREGSRGRMDKIWMDKIRLDERVLREGFSTLALPGFVEELRRRLERAGRVLRPVRGAATEAAAWRDLLIWSRRDCDLALARYLFEPHEVVGRVRQALRTSRGEREPVSGMVATEAADALARLPSFEAAIATGLLGTSEVYWSGEATGSALHGLAEAPEGTVVVTIKPPGSSCELEIKRTGVRAARPLSVVYERSGAPVPPSHRLDGGSVLRQLHFDAIASALFTRIYRIVHAAKGEEAPFPRTLAIHAIRTVPSGSDPAGEAHLVDHLSREAVFGAGFAEMREALKASADAFDREIGTPVPDREGDLWLTARFLAHAPPGQALLTGTSSFRLDRVAAYLATGESRELVDQVLDEVLGVYEPPTVPYGKRYVAAALAVPANRERANRAHLAAVRGLGRVRGTLMALGGWSNGESFVARNVGLRSHWTGGRWEVRLTLMDHDDLHVEPAAFRPLTALSGMEMDEEFARRSLRFLSRIYRVSPARGRAALNGEMRSAYQETLRHLAAGSLAGVLPEEGIRWLLDWSALLAGFRSIPVLPTPRQAWRRRARRFLADRGWSRHAVTYAVEGLERHERFLSGYAFLD